MWTNTWRWFDFVNRLKDDPTQLTILGVESNPNRMYVSDVVKAVTTLPFKHANKFEVYNIAQLIKYQLIKSQKKYFNN